MSFTGHLHTYSKANKVMEPVNIHIATQSKYVRVFALLVKLLGGVYTVERAGKRDLKSLIEKSEQDFTDGKGTVMTIDELRALTNEVA